MARGAAKYPSNYVPKPADIPGPVMQDFLRKKRCQGWFAESLTILGVEHDVRPLLLDLHPGESWYADQHFHQSALMPEYASCQGTFWHRECEGFDCTKCSSIPSLADFRARLKRETSSETSLKRGKRVCNPSAESFESIKAAFDDHVVGTMCSVVLLNPLCAGLPTLVLGILPTCNTFNHERVQSRWDQVRSFLDAHFADLGVLVSRGSDGDRRRVKCMLRSISTRTYDLERPGFIMRARIVGGYPLLMDQDAFHVGKKIRNPLLIASRNVFWGTHLATINHLKLVM